jgi:FMN reductase (NADPH)
MNNPTLDLMHRHASVRHYRPDPVPHSLIETIISAAQCASTSSNLQMYSVIVVTDTGRREQFSDLCGNQAQIREAPVFLVWCADLARLNRVCELRGYSQVTVYVENFLAAAVDVALVAQNAALAAESMGLGICYIGYIRNIITETIELLELPRLTFPITGMTLGWPSKEPRPHPRLPLRAILHKEKYDPNQDRELHQYDRTMVESGLYHGRQVPVPGQSEQLEDYGWLEHSARRVSKVERAGLCTLLEKQGFGLK